MRFCTVHTHSLLCDGKDTLEEMARAAFDAGAVSFGASGHSYTPIPWDAGNVLPETAEEYRAEVLRLRKAYEGRMEVLLGIEQDSQSLQPVPDWAEYWIGSVHNLRDPRTGKWYCVDWDPERLEICRREMFGGDGLAMARGYYADVAAMAQRRPTILGHLDLIVKLNRKGCFLTRRPLPTGPRLWRPSTPQTRTPRCWRSTPAPWPGDTGMRPTRRCFCCGSGGPWGAGSFSPLTPTAPRR